MVEQTLLSLGMSAAQIAALGNGWEDFQAAAIIDRFGAMSPNQIRSLIARDDARNGNVLRVAGWKEARNA